MMQPFYVLWSDNFISLWWKATCLHNLKKEYFNVPDGFVLKSDIWVKALHESYINHINSNYYIVRSCCSMEDSHKLSYAGMFDSYVWLYSKWDIYNHVQKVFHSIQDPKISEYEEAILGYSISDKNMHVLIQKYIQPDFSWVYFSNLATKKILHIIKWWNTPLVMWIDSWIMMEFTSNFLLKSRYEDMQKNFQNYDNILKNQTITIDIDDISLSIITKNLQNLENIFDYPIDIERGIKDSIFYIFQVRPITT